MKKMTNRIEVSFDAARPDGEQWIVVTYARRGFSTMRFATKAEAFDHARNLVDDNRWQRRNLNQIESELTLSDAATAQWKREGKL
jgi:hypothetical protein